jgi:MFS family permease
MKRPIPYLTIFNATIWERNDFVRLWLAQAISLVGDQIYVLALPLLVYTLTHSASQMSVVFAFEMLPFFFCSVLGGVLADKWGRQRSMILGNLLAMLPLLLIFLLHTSGNLHVWHIYGTSFLLSCVVAIILPACESCIPTVVPQAELASANSLIELTLSLTLILGPVLAGGLIGWLGTEGALLIDALSFLVAGLIFLTLHLPPATIDDTGLSSVFRAFWEGLVYVPKHCILRWGMFMSTLSNIALGAYTAMLIFHMRDKLGLNVEVTGLVLALSNITSLLVAAFGAAHLSRHFPQGLLMIITLALQGLGVMLVGLSSSLLVLAVAQALYTGALTLYTISWRTLRQTVTPNSMIGRVSGVSRGIAYTGASLGGFLGGGLLRAFTPTELFVIDGAIVILVAIVTLLGPVYSRGAEVEWAKYSGN